MKSVNSTPCTISGNRSYSNAAKRKAGQQTDACSSSSNDDHASILLQLTQMQTSMAQFTEQISNNLCSAITTLTNTMNEKFDKIISLLENTSNSTQNAMEVPVPQTNSIDSAAMLSELRNLKNARNESLFKLAHNITHAQVYSNGLEQTPQLVPKKLHEPVLHTDSDELKEMKNRRTLRNVEDEIEKLNYHKKIQQNKIAVIDAKAKTVIQSITDTSAQAHILANWNAITKRGEESIENKMQKKRQFLEGDNHMVELGNFIGQRKSNGPQGGGRKSIRDNQAMNPSRAKYGYREHKFYNQTQAGPGNCNNQNNFPSRFYRGSRGNKYDNPPRTDPRNRNDQGNQPPIVDRGKLFNPRINNQQPNDNGWQQQRSKNGKRRGPPARFK